MCLATGDPYAVLRDQTQQTRRPLCAGSRACVESDQRAFCSVSTAAHPDYRVRRAQLSRSVNDSQGFSVYDAIVDQIDWKDPTPWLSLLRALNDSQRAVVAVAQVHEHAQFNGIEASVDFHGLEVVEMAADGAACLGNTKLEAMIREALAADPDWEQLERKWDQEAEFEIESFIEGHAPDFFVDE